MTVWRTLHEDYAGKIECGNCWVVRGAHGCSPVECVRAFYSEGWRCFYGLDLCPNCTDLLYTSHVETLRPGYGAT